MVYHVKKCIVTRGVFCVCVPVWVCVSLCLSLSSKGVGRLCCRQRYVGGGESGDVSAGTSRVSQRTDPVFVAVIYCESVVTAQPTSLMWPTAMDTHAHTRTHTQGPKQIGRPSDRHHV